MFVLDATLGHNGVQVTLFGRGKFGFSSDVLEEGLSFEFIGLFLVGEESGVIHLVVVVEFVHGKLELVDGDTLNLSRVKERVEVVVFMTNPVVQTDVISAKDHTSNDTDVFLRKESVTPIGNSTNLRHVLQKWHLIILHARVLGSQDTVVESRHESVVDVGLQLFFGFHLVGAHGNENGLDGIRRGVARCLRCVELHKLISTLNLALETTVNRPSIVNECLGVTVVGVASVHDVSKVTIHVVTSGQQDGSTDGLFNTVGDDLHDMKSKLRIKTGNVVRRDSRTRRTWRLVDVELRTFGRRWFHLEKTCRTFGSRTEEFTGSRADATARVSGALRTSGSGSVGCTVVVVGGHGGQKVEFFGNDLNLRKFVR